MRKSIFAFYLILFYIWSFSIFNAVKADDYNKAVVGHVISETIKGTNMLITWQSFFEYFNSKTVIVN